MTISNLNEWATLLQSIATIAAIALGGSWAFYHYRRKREHLWNIDCSTTATVETCSTDRILITVQVEMKNVGSKVFIPGAEGLQIAAKRVSVPDSGPLPDWESSELVLNWTDILAKYKPEGATSYDGVYSLGVQATYREQFHLVLESGHMYLVKTALTEHGTNDRIVDYLLVNALGGPIVGNTDGERRSAEQRHAADGAARRR